MKLRNVFEFCFVVLGINCVQAFRGNTNHLFKMSNVLSADTVAAHNTAKDCWVIVSGQVLDVTKFLSNHINGPEVILSMAGKDVTQNITDNSSHDGVDLTKQDGVKLMGSLDTSKAIVSPGPSPQVETTSLFSEIAASSASSSAEQDKALESNFSEIGVLQSLIAEATQSAVMNAAPNPPSGSISEDDDGVIYDIVTATKQLSVIWVTAANSPSVVTTTVITTAIVTAWPNPTDSV